MNQFECPTCHCVACICPEDHENVIVRTSRDTAVGYMPFKDAMEFIEDHPGCYCEREKD